MAWPLTCPVSAWCSLPLDRLWSWPPSLARGRGPGGCLMAARAFPGPWRAECDPTPSAAQHHFQLLPRALPYRPPSPRWVAPTAQAGCPSDPLHLPSQSSGHLPLSGPPARPGQGRLAISWGLKRPLPGCAILPSITLSEGHPEGPLARQWDFHTPGRGSPGSWAVRCAPQTSHAGSQGPPGRPS